MAVLSLCPWKSRVALGEFVELVPLYLYLPALSGWLGLYLPGYEARLSGGGAGGRFEEVAGMPFGEVLCTYSILSLKGANLGL